MELKEQGPMVRVLLGASRFVAKTGARVVNKGLRVVEEASVRARAVLGPLYPWGNERDAFCCVVASEEDVKLVNRAASSVRVVCHEERLESRVRKRHRVISYERIASEEIPVVVLLSPQRELELEERLMRLHRETSFPFSIYDRYATSRICERFEGRTYRKIQLSIYPTVLFPTYYSNWSYINYLLDEVVRDQPLAVLDMFAGSGVIGLSLKKEAPLTRVSYSDVNFWATKSIREAMSQDPSLTGKVWLSECFSNIPATEQYDLIVGGPPHWDARSMSPATLAGSDGGWEVHEAFFSQAHRHLKPGGQVVFVEAIDAKIYEEFYERLFAKSDSWEELEYVRLRNHACFVIRIGLRGPRAAQR